VSTLYIGKAGEERVEIKTDVLTTHAVCLGTTGSGKTGLGIALIEELARKGVPGIVIDPKGDMTNLKLIFEKMTAKRFAPWIGENEDAAKVCRAWKRGLAKDGLSDAASEILAGSKIRLLTPGDTEMAPMRFVAPAVRAPADPADFAKVVQDYAKRLLEFAGVPWDDGESPEAMLVVELMLEHWVGMEEHWATEDPDKPGRTRPERVDPITVETILYLIQSTHLGLDLKIGSVPVDTACPPRLRVALARRLNAAYKGQSKATWFHGFPLDIDAMLRQDAIAGERPGPAITVLSLAHLPEEARMFVVASVLDALVAWVRRQSGSSKLKAFLYMDEVAGYFPPVAMPRSKPHMLTLLKQARSAGLGIVLATQNPVDIDYKGLSNIGTWLVGRLGTSRDRARIMAAVESEDSAEAEALVASLKPREFVLCGSRHDEPVAFRSRHAVSFLAGPPSRDALSGIVDRPPPPREIEDEFPGEYWPDDALEDDGLYSDWPRQPWPPPPPDEQGVLEHWLRNPPPRLKWSLLVLLMVVVALVVFGCCL